MNFKSPTLMMMPGILKVVVVAVEPLPVVIVVTPPLCVSVGVPQVLS